MPSHEGPRRRGGRFRRAALGVGRVQCCGGGTFSQGGFELSEPHVPRWVRLHMVREKDGRWKVQDYEHAPPQQFMYSQKLDDGAGP